MIGLRGGLLRQRRLDVRADGIGRGAEPAPEPLGAFARRGGDGLPLRRQLAHAASGKRRVCVLGERFHLGDQPFLHVRVRPALPVVGLAKRQRLRLQLDARGAQLAEQLVARLVLRRRLERGLRGNGVGNRAVERLQRGVLDAHEIAEALDGLQALPALLVGLGDALVAPLRVALRERGVGGASTGERVGSLGRAGERLGRGSPILPQAARALTQLTRGRVPLVGDDRLERRGQVVQLPQTVGSRGKVVAPLVRVTGSGVESRVQIARGGMIDGIQGVPLRDDGGLRLDGRVGGESLQPRDEHAAHSKRGLERVGGAVRGLARGPCLRERVARGRHGRRVAIGQPGIGVGGAVVPLGDEAIESRVGACHGCRLGQPLDVVHQVPELAARLDHGLLPGHVGGRGCGVGLVHGAKNRARPARGGLVGATRRDVLDGGAIRGDALERADGDVAKSAAQRRGDQLGRVGESGQRLETNRLVLGAPGDAAERLLVAAEARERGEADALALRGLGDQDELLLRGRPWQRRQRVERGKTRRLFGLERAQRDVEQDAGGLIADALVGIGAERLGQHGHGAELADRRPPHARIAVVSSDRGQQVLLVLRYFLNARGPYRRILGLPFRLRLESVQNTHRFRRVGEGTGTPAREGRDR